MTHPRPSGSVRSVAVALLAASAGVASPAAGQAASNPAGTATPPPASPAPAAGNTTQELAARALTRLAMVDLRVAGEPNETDYTVAAALLGAASSLAPHDQDILRLLIEAEANSGDTAGVEEHTRRLVALDPKDTVAQLRLITARINALQNADDRLAAFENYLGPRGQAIDPSVRSRLALDAALLLRERGDIEGFAKRLSQAVQLDRTNKDAATLALTFFSQRVDDAAGRLDLLLNVLNADPLDPEVHRSIARMLAEAGAFRGARRFYDTLEKIYAAQGVSAPGDEANDRLVVEWCLEGPREVLTRMNRELEQARANVRAQRRGLEKATPPPAPEELPDPADVRLTMTSEWSRTVAAAAVGDAELLDRAVEEMVETARREADALTDPEQRPTDMSDADATDRLRGLLEETVWIRLWTGRQLDQVGAGLEVLRNDAATDPQRLARLEGWHRLRLGDIEGGERALSPMASQHVMADLGLALATELRGDSAAAAKRYADLALAHAGSLPAAYARTRAATLSGKAFDDGPLAKKLDAAALAVPAWLETLVEGPRRFQSLDATSESRDVRLLDRMRLRVAVRNTSPVPLGLGPSGPINSRVMAAPGLEIGSQTVGTGGMLAVASLDRRLRLMPQEAVETIMWPDAGGLGLLLDQFPGAFVRIRWRVVQGFQMTQRAVFEAGPYSLSADGGTTQRSASSKAAADVPSLLRSIESGSTREMAETLLVTRARLALSGDAGLAAADAKPILEAAAKRFPTLDPAAQALMLALLPDRGQTADAEPIEAMARQSTDPVVATVLMSVRASDPDDPLLAEGAWSGRPELARLAGACRERLKAGRASLATVGSRAGAAAAAAPPTPEPTAAPASEGVPLTPDAPPPAPSGEASPNK